MPNKLWCTFLLGIAGCGGSLLSAQEKGPGRPDQVVVLGGIAVEGGSGIFQTAFVSAERPLGAYRHVGLQYTAYLSERSNGYYYATLRRGSYEVGLISKFFLPRRLSGRRSRLYYGPQVRFGVRKMVYDPANFGSGFSSDFQVNTTKILFCMGGQYQVGHAVFGWSVPLGAEFGRSNLPARLDPYGYYSSSRKPHFTALPSIGLGFRL